MRMKLNENNRLRSGIKATEKRVSICARIEWIRLSTSANLFLSFSNQQAKRRTVESHRPGAFPTPLLTSLSLAKTSNKSLHLTHCSSAAFSFVLQSKIIKICVRARRSDRRLMLRSHQKVSSVKKNFLFWWASSASENYCRYLRWCFAFPSARLFFTSLVLTSLWLRFRCHWRRKENPRGRSGDFSQLIPNATLLTSLPNGLAYKSHSRCF